MPHTQVEISQIIRKTDLPLILSIISDFFKSPNETSAIINYVNSYSTNREWAHHACVLVQAQINKFIAAKIRKWFSENYSKPSRVEECHIVTLNQKSVEKIPEYLLLEILQGNNEDKADQERTRLNTKLETAQLELTKAQLKVDSIKEKLANLR